MNAIGLVRQRMMLAKSIAHCRLMIRRNYHTGFFKELLIKHQINQSKVLLQEREMKMNELKLSNVLGLTEVPCSSSVEERKIFPWESRIRIFVISFVDASSINEDWCSPIFSSFIE